MVMITDEEAILIHALLMNIASDCHIMAVHEQRLRAMAARLMPEKDEDLPAFNRASHVS